MNYQVRILKYKRDTNLPNWADHASTLPDKEKEEYLLKKAGETYDTYTCMASYTPKVAMEYPAYAQCLLADADAYLHKKKLREDKAALKKARADMAAQKRQLAIDKRIMKKREQAILDEQLVSATARPSKPKTVKTLEEIRLKNRQYQAKCRAKARLAKMYEIRSKHNDDLNL